MEKIAKNIVHKIIPINDYSDIEIKKMEYGLTCMLNEITKLIPFFILFFIFNLHIEYIIALIFFCPIRIFSGGYHAETYWGCFVISLISFSAIIFIGENLIISQFIISILLLISFLLIFILSPVDNINKRIISKQKRIRHKYYSILICFILIMLTFIIPQCYLAIAVLSIALSAIMTIIGFIINKLN